MNLFAAELEVRRRQREAREGALAARRAAEARQPEPARPAAEPAPRAVGGALTSS
ncbi:MAG: hypothetical protein M0T72_00395 [Candidatus Dormibacteraeota bacterium]|nr:hypothetical protein [Candidatus Dormibacteraeota bacterium]